jgi:hypothetical protein
MLDSAFRQNFDNVPPRHIWITGVGPAQHDGARGIGESHTIEGQRLEVNDSVCMPCQSGNGVLKLAILLGLGGQRYP